VVPAGDGREVLQMRIEMGLLQMELAGRPDGEHPGGAETCLDWLRELQRSEGDVFTLNEEQCMEIDREFLQFYHRRICCLAIRQFARAVADAEYTLALMDFVAQHSPNEQWTVSHEQYRPFVLFHRIQAAALPTFVSPFAWRAIRQYPSGYELSDRNVLAADRVVPQSWMPADTGPEVARARATPTGRIFLDFSRFPSSHVIERGAHGVVVRLVDVRFAAMGERLQADPRARSPFVVTVTIDAAGRVVREQLGN
jgi:hypothetical protein